MIPTIAGRGRTKHVAPTVNPSEWVYIVSSALNSLPNPGDRVGPSDASNMPQIVASGTNPAITVADGASKYRLVGLDIKSGNGNNVTNLVEMGVSATSSGSLPSDIIFDRCYIHNASGTSGRRGIWLNAVRGTVVDSYISGFREAGSDSQAVLVTNTVGPIKIVNNYLEGASENFHVGGSDPAIDDAVPSDIEFRRNYCYKPLSWVGAGYNVKNLLEFKNAQRVLCEGNVFENNWADGQSGLAFLITPRNQQGTAPWSGTFDITFRLNKMLNIEGGINVGGTDDVYSSQNTTRVTISDNFLKLSYEGGGDHRGFQLVTDHTYQSGASPTNVHITNNTIIHTNSSGSAGVMASGGVKMTGIIIRDNIVSNAAYGYLGVGSGDGNDTINTHFDTDAVFTHNVIIGGTSGNYTGRTGCQFPANVAAVSFTDSASDDYSLSGGSSYKNDGSDGTDPGADWTALNAAVLHAVDGQWGSEHATYTDRSYTNAEIPRTYIDSSYGSLPTGTTHVCTTAAQFTTALANCVSGDVIQLAANTTFTGNFTLRAR